MGGQQKKNNHGARNEIMGFTASHKPAGLDLMQNCDLPPPSKVFMGPDKVVMLSMNRGCNIAGKEEEHSKNSSTYEIEKNGDDHDSDKMKLLRALQASQTRAREAEKKAAVLSKERDSLSMAFMEEAMHLFAYRQQVRFLEFQVSNLQPLWLQQQQQQQQQPAMPCSCTGPTEGAVGSSKEDDGHGEERSSFIWVLALVFSFGIGMTTALTCRYCE